MRLYLSSFRLGNKPEALLQLLAGRTRTALIGNAMDFLDEWKRAESIVTEVDRLKGIGLMPAEIDLREYFGEDEELKRVLAEFDLIWVRGGNAFVLLRAFKQSGADEIIKRLLAQDAVVYGGYSAGIDVLGPTLHGAELVDDPSIVPKGYSSSIIWDGLNILPYSIASHYKSSHPESADVDKSVQYLIDNKITFKALRDGEAIVICDGQEKVVS
jgi:dipeptidase E